MPRMLLRGGCCGTCTSAAAARAAAADSMAVPGRSSTFLQSAVGLFHADVRIARAHRKLITTNHKHRQRRSLYPESVVCLGVHGEFPTRSFLASPRASPMPGTVFARTWIRHCLVRSSQAADCGRVCGLTDASARLRRELLGIANAVLTPFRVQLYKSGLDMESGLGNWRRARRLQAAHGRGFGASDGRWTPCPGRSCRAAL